MICAVLFLMVRTTVMLLTRRDSRPEEVVRRTLVEENEHVDTLSADQLLRIARSQSEGRFLKRDTDAARSSFMRAKALSFDPAIRGEALLGLGELAEARGDAEGAILHYLEGVGEGFEECVLRIGRLYQYGLHPFYLPDKLEAGRYYKYFQEVSPTLTPWVNASLREVMRTSYGDLDDVRVADGREYKTLPGDICMRAMRAWESKRGDGIRARSFPSTIDRAPQIDAADEELQLVYFDDDVMDIYMELEHASPKTRNDAQNSHDTAVTNSARHMLWTGDSMDAEADFDACADEFLATPEVEVDENAKRVMRTFTSKLHSKFDRSERDAFVMVWRRIAELSSAERRRDAARALASNLSSGVEHGFVVCSTGKIERVLSTLDVLSVEDGGEALIRPEWVIREEIGRTSANALERELERGGEATLAAYNTLEPTESEKKLTDDVKRAVRLAAETQCAADYVASGMYDASAIDALVSEYLQFV